MASLASTSVTVNFAWTDGEVTGKRYLHQNLTLVLSTNGSETNPIPASALGFAAIRGATTFVKSDNSVILTAGPDYTGANLLLTVNGTPADETGTFVGEVWGTEYQLTGGAGS